MLSKEAFRNRLRELRRERGETQAEVGSALGIGARHYQKFEAEDNYPSAENLCALADHFAVSLDYLMGRTDDRAAPGK